MKILGISALYHDSAAAIVEDGKVTAAAQEERFTRKKHDDGFPLEAVKFCLHWRGLSLDDLDAVVFYDKPFLKFERLIETYYNVSPKGWQSFIRAIPVWAKEKLFLKKLIRDELKKVGNYDRNKLKLLFPEHHLSHAASAFYPSPFEDAAILTIDGVGEWATASICHGTGKDIKILKELRFPHSVGLLYSAFTYFLGFRVNSGEYKLMGLAPYGNPGSEAVERYKKIIREKLVTVYPDGSIWINQKYFTYAHGLRMIHDASWAELFGMAKRNPETDFEQKHCDLALAIQEVTEDIVLRMAREAQRLTGSRNLCLAGGVALNCVANGKIVREKIFEGVFIQPASGDAGGAPGAALAAAHIHFGQERIVKPGDDMDGSYLGPSFSGLDVELMSRKYKAAYQRFDQFEDLAKATAKHLSQEKVVGWFQGRMEFGPRALGNRSILGDPRSEEMQKKLNLKIKYRESFRPFAPSVLQERSKDYFDLEGESPYMLLVAPVKDSRRKQLPEDYHQLPLREKLYHLRSDVPAITHIDFSARIQTVNETRNPRYYGLIKAFEGITGYGMLVNTSFNVRGEPIVCTPEDAYKCLMRTEMDVLVVGDYLFLKEEQPEWKEQINWREEYVLD